MTNLFLMYVIALKPRKYQLLYAKMARPSEEHTCAVCETEIYQTFIWCKAEDVLDRVVEIQESIIESSIEFPSHLVYQFGGVYRNQYLERGTVRLQ